MTDLPSATAAVLTEAPLASGGHRLALALGGGAARGLAHIGVLEVLEREGIRPDSITGSSMGGLIGALSAAGLRARDILDAARHFRFPSWFIFGRTLEWEAIFPSAARVLERVTFDGLGTPLLITAVDLQLGSQVILDSGPVLPAVRATCAVPGVLPPVKLDGRWLVDGGVLNVLPVDVAWMAEPDVVMAVNVGGLRARRLPQLDWRTTAALSLLGTILPNPATAKVAFEVLVRASEIVLAHQTTLATAMTGPEVVVEPRLEGIGLRDFQLLDEAVEAGRRAAEEMLPELSRALGAPARPPRSVRTLHFDPVCRMVVSPGRARARTAYFGEVYYFCSENCRDCFVRAPSRYAPTMEVPMRIEQLMTKPVITCTTNDNLTTAAQLMWEHDCGAIPVVDDGGQLVGIVTDRDICMATYTRGSAPQNIPVVTTMARDVCSCRIGDSVDTAERLMRQRQIRRVPVVDETGRPIGLLSLNDITRSAARAKKRGDMDRGIVDTLAAICEPRPAEARATAPTAA